MQCRPLEADHDGRLTVLAGDLGTFGTGLDEGAQNFHVGTTLLDGVVQRQVVVRVEAFGSDGSRVQQGRNDV